MNYPLIKPKYYFQLFKEISNFIKSPKIGRDEIKSTRIKIYDTIGLYILKMIFLVPVILFFAIVYDPENVITNRMADRFTPLMFLVVGGLILPLVEEVAFRLSLRLKPIYLVLSVSVFLYYFLSKLIFDTKISAVDDSFVTRISIAVLTGLILYPIVSFKWVEVMLRNFWEKHFRTIYYISCIVFAWIHIGKYEINTLNVLLLPILTLPQLMSAVINGYTRVSFGFQYPLLFHMANNLIGIGLSFLTLSDIVL